MAGLPRSIYDDFDPAQPAEPMDTGAPAGSIYDDFERNLELDNIREEARTSNSGNTGRAFKGGFYGAVGSAIKGVGAVTGSKAVEDYADTYSAEAEGLLEGSTDPGSLKEIDSVGGALGYARRAIASGAGSSIPSLGAGIVAGAVGGPVAGIGTALAVGSAQGTGQSIEAQEDQAGERDLLTAVGTGVAQGAVDVIGGITGRGIRAVAGNIAKDAAEQTLRQKLVRTAREEAAQEVTQQTLEESSRYGVDSEFNILNRESGERILEAGVQGALAGGAVGAVIPNARKRDAVPSADPNVASTDPVVSAAADEKGEPLQITGPRAEPARIEDQRNWRRDPETGEVIAAGAPQGTPARQEVLDIFTGATPETLRPTSEGEVVRAVRGDLPLDANVRQITMTVMDTLNGGKARGKKATVLPVTDRVAAAYEALDALAEKFAASPNIKPEKQESYLAALARAAEVVQAYELNLESLGVPRTTNAPTVDQMAGPGVPIEKPGQINAAQAGFNSLVRPSEDIGQLTVDAKIAQQNMAAQQQAEQQRAIELGMVEQAQAEQKAAEEVAKSQEEQQALQQEDNLRIANEQLQPAQRQELLDSIIKSSKPNVTPLQSFLKGLKRIAPDALPTDAELAALAQYTNLSYADKVKEAEKVKPAPEKLVAKAPQNEALLEPVSVPAKMSKRQQRAMQARAEATALVPENQQPPEIKSMLKALEEAATSIDATFKSLLKSAPIEGEQMSLFPEEPRTPVEGSKGFRKYVAAKIAAQDAKFEAQLAEMQAAVAKLAQPAPTPEPKQAALLDAKGKPTKAALRLTPDQVAEQVAEKAKSIPNDADGAVIKFYALPEIQDMIGKVPGETVLDLMDIIAMPGQKLANVQTAIAVTQDKFMPKAAPTPAPTTTEAAPAVDEETDNAAFQEPDNEPDIPLFRRNPEDGDVVPRKVEAVRARVADIIKGWRNPPRFVVFDLRNPRSIEEEEAVATYNELPYYGYYDEKSKAVFIPANGIPMTNALLRGTVYHEALGHYGFKQQFGSQKGDLMRDIAADRPDILRGAQRYYPEYYNAFLKNGVDKVRAERYARALAVEEHLVQKWNDGELALSANLWGRMRDFVTKFARMMGLPARRYTNGEIIHMMHGARNAVIGADPDGTRASLEERGILPKNFKARREDIVAQRRTAPEAAISSASTAPEILRSRSMNLRSKLAKRGVPEPFINLAVTANDVAQNIKLGTLLGRNLVDEAVRQGLPSAKRLFDIQQAVMAKTNEYVKTLDQLVVDAMNLDGVGEAFRGKTPKRDALNKYLQKATIGGKWGYQPTWKSTPVQIDPAAERMTNEFKAKYPDAFAVADAIFQYSDKARTDLQDAVTKFIEQETAGDLANALTPAERKAVEDRKQRELKLFNKLVPRLDGPYAPLSRFGQYAAIAKSARFVELEKKVKEGKADKDEVAELGNLRTDANHYAVFFRDSQADADNVLLKLLQDKPAFKGGQLYASVRNEVFEQIGESPIMQMQRFKDMMVKELGETDRLGRKTTREIEGIIKDLYIRTLAETSARQHDQYREGIEGADEDMLRSFAQKGRSDAHILAQITDRHEIGQVMQTMIGTESAVRDEKYQDRKRVLREILMRHKQEMLAEETPVQDKLMAASSLYHLAMSPRYYLMNSLQPWMVSAPYLAGRHGVQAYGKLYDAYKSLAPQMKSKDFWKGKVDLGKLQGLTDAERDALKQMQLNGLLELGQQYDQGYWEASDGPARFMSEATHVFRTLSGQVEYINRVSSALAAYRLSGGKVDAMTDILARTQFDYSSRNQPRYFNALPKVITQFRKYQLGQLALWLGMLGDAKTSPEARRMLAYMTGQLAIVTGAVGLPAAQLFGVVGSLLFKEDDEPLDGEKWLTDLVGDGVAARGIGTLIGVELANGLGLGTLVNPFPFLNYSELDSRDGVRDAAFTVLGPSAGLVDKAQRGLEAVQQGEYLRALGEALPSGVTNAVRAYEMATRGYEKKNGDMLLSPEELGEVNIMLQALGFAPSVKLTAQRVNGQKVQYEEHFKQRASTLKRSYAQAQEDRDVESMRELEAKWDALQKTKEQYGFKKTPRAELLKARAEQKKREKNTVGGVQVTNSNRRFVEQALE